MNKRMLQQGNATQTKFIPYFIVVCTVLFATSFVRAETIEFDEEELAKESVLPVFAKKVVVRERKVKAAGRFELAGGGGLNLIEPLYSQMTFSMAATYMLDEINGINLMGYFLMDELSDAGEDLKAGKGLESGNFFDASKAPKVEQMVFANYVFNAYYGKMSITKQSTMNLMLYGLAGAGIVNWTDSTTFGLDVGLGQKFYFSDRLSLRFDLIMAMYPGPDPTSPSDGDLLPSEPEATSDEFDSIFYFRPFLTAGISFLF